MDDLARSSLSRVRDGEDGHLGFCLLLVAYEASARRGEISSAADESLTSITVAPPILPSPVSTAAMDVGGAFCSLESPSRNSLVKREQSD